MEKDILLLYNPKAGDTFFRFELERFLNVFGNMGCTVRIFRSQYVGDMAECIRRTNMEEMGLIIAAGGDGTVNEVLQAMMEKNQRVPLGIIPAGTTNDVARFLEMPEDYGQCIEVLCRQQMEAMNIGEVNGRFFMNRCGFGNMVSISQSTSQDMKNTFGKMAYYMKGVTQLPATDSFHLRVRTADGEYEGEFIMFLVLNGKASRIQNHSFEVEDPVSDQLEFVGIRKGSSWANHWMLFKSIRKVPSNQKWVLRIKADEMEISSDDIPERMRVCYVDGEVGPEMPLKFTLHKNALQVITNRECSTWNNVSKELPMFHVEQPVNPEMEISESKGDQHG